MSTILNAGDPWPVSWAVPVGNCQYVPTYPQWNTYTTVWPQDNTARVEALEAKVARLERQVRRLRRAKYQRKQAS